MAYLQQKTYFNVTVLRLTEYLNKSMINIHFKVNVYTFLKNTEKLAADNKIRCVKEIEHH